jgi:radical SAM superfamily enzyme YgiQ (UPF0313 family)
MKILLISPNTEMLPDPVFPLGLAYLSAALEESAHDYRVLDLCFVDDFAVAIEQAVTEFRPEAIGLSLRNVDNVAYPDAYSYLPFYQKVIACLRQLTEAPVILGGSGFSLMPEAILSHLKADYGIRGEGEMSLIRLLDHLDGHMTAVGIPGVFSRVALHRREPPPPSPSHLPIQKLPMPCRAKFDNEKYLRLGGMGNIQTKRGCCFSCIYCTYPIIEGREVRLRPPNEVAREMAQMAHQGIDTFFIVDSVFNFPPHHANSVCLEILKGKLRARWSCYLHPGFITESLLHLMKEAGCSSVEFGVDSGSSAILERLNKSFTKDDVRRASGLCHKVGIPFCHSLIFGVPGETRQSVQETFDLMAEIDPTAVIAMCGIRVFPGTKLAEVASADDLVQADESMLAPTFYIEKSSRSFLLDMLYAHVEKNRHWIMPGSHINIDLRLQQKLRRFGLKGPLWEHMQTRRR